MRKLTVKYRLKATKVLIKAFVRLWTSKNYNQLMKRGK